MKKEVIGVIIFLCIMLAIYFIGRQRFDDINSGRMIVVSESERDR